MYRAPADVITGFLGSGKTTLARRLLASPAGRRVALVVNELAGIDVDGRVLGGLRAVERAIELPGGCICCEIRESRFARAIDELVERTRPDLVVVETSGVAEPAATTARLRDAGLSIDAVIALVDAEHAEETLARQAIARAQVAGADFLVLNRTDLVAPQAVAPLARRLRRWNERALVLPAVRAEVDLDLLFGTGAARLRAGARTERADGFATSTRLDPANAAPRPTHGLVARVLRFAGAVSRDRLARTLARLPESVHRTKGIARVADSELAILFNGVRRRVELEWLPFAATESQAVVIGEGLDAIWPEIEALLVACIEPDDRRDDARRAGGEPRERPRV